MSDYVDYGETHALDRDGRFCHRLSHSYCTSAASLVSTSLKNESGWSSLKNDFYNANQQLTAAATNAEQLKYDKLTWLCRNGTREGKNVENARDNA